ncbi:PhaM family polyhydroxyalkanoate granule multifunctional regulatory protein [Herbaspirillum sp. alder98]|uniref:PhaM family polyhydroxyalkanoate granule multifunctional regulatory protein n=1 Tax=Herbaspirillum sp. alder98 TaxID=2913096 RepID=UPI001CD90491|nr:PhaM family polyhydroxyalkanoate granule multifunctional regulatory protein [Herbaspirillum sp. alder98]MCA1324187.1 pilus assembly protein FimV [Herbaspirillum sp. alder98]
MLNHDKMPGAGSAADTIDFMKQMWGSVGTPPMMMPSLSVEDINKKISDLKTVASWLELNLNMLKGTIQTFEVQSATLSTLQAMSAIMASKGGDSEAAAASAAPSFPFGFPMWPGGAPEAAAPAEPEPEPEAAEPPADSAQAEPELPPSPDLQAAIGNPTAWWNLLQDQFKQAVDNAMTHVQPEPDAALKPTRTRSEKKTTAPKAAKSVAKSTIKPSAKSVTPAKNPQNTVISSSTVGKQRKVTKNASPSGRTGAVQSGHNKKPASRKP